MGRHSADSAEPPRRPPGEAPPPPLGPVTDPLLLAGVEEELRRRRPPADPPPDEGPAGATVPERSATPPAPPADFAPRSGRERAEAEAEQDGPVLPETADAQAPDRTADAPDGPDRIGLSVPTMLIWIGVGVLAAVALSLAAVLL